MELELIDRIPAVFNYVIIKRACFPLKLGILGSQRLSGVMYRPVVFRNRALSVENFRLTVQFIYDVLQIPLIEERFPIQRMKIGLSF